MGYWFPYPELTLIACFLGALLLFAGTLSAFFGCVRLLLVQHRAAACLLGVASVGLSGVLVIVPTLARVAHVVWLQRVFAFPLMTGPGTLETAVLMLIPQDFGVVWGLVGLTQFAFAAGLFLVRRPEVAAGT